MNVSSQLNHVLHTHQLFAMHALGGPSLWSSEISKLAAGARFTENCKAAVLETLRQQNNNNNDKELPRSLPFDFKFSPSLPVQSSPFLLTADSECEQGVATLEGEKIACLKIGGEKRLCLPEMLKAVFAEFSLDMINQACDDLQIYCSRCNPEQLRIFKSTGNLLATAPTCGLITMTDAERLCSILLHGSTFGKPEPSFNHNYQNQISSTCIPVYHECFGEGRGFLKPDLYYSYNSKCIECTDCLRLYSPEKFVGHSHSCLESRTCHWGFDRKNWRMYLQFDEEKVAEEADMESLRNVYNETIERFASTTSILARKRKALKESSDNSSPLELVKNRKLSDSAVHTSQEQQRPWLSTTSLASAFPWNIDAALALVKSPAKLQTTKSCPPKLENPKSVVPSAEKNRYGAHFVPNVSLQQQPETVNMKKSKAAETSAASDSPTSADENKSFGDSSQLFILEGLANMESQFMKVIKTSTACSEDKEIWEQKYMAYSDSIRKFVMSNSNYT